MMMLTQCLLKFILQFKYLKLNSREEMAQRTNSIQWRVTLPPAKLSFIIKLGGRNLSNKVGAMGDFTVDTYHPKQVYYMHMIKKCSIIFHDVMLFF